MCIAPYLNSKTEKIINESDIDDAFQSICSMITSNIQKSVGRGFGWITDTVSYQTIQKDISD